MKRRFAALVLLASATPLTAQWLTLSTPGIPRTSDGAVDISAPAPRTADGRPDLSGLWVPGDFEGSLFDPNAVQEWAQAAVVEAERSFYGSNPRFLCLPSGPAYLTAGRTAGGVRRIVQSPSMIVFLYSDLIYRQIFMDGRELELDPLPTWMGYSVGRWEGDTLVVETSRINWPYFDGIGTPQSEAVEVVERFTLRQGGQRLDYHATITDPQTFTRPATAELYWLALGESVEPFGCTLY